MVELKDSSELAVDLAYSALLFKNRAIASEVMLAVKRADEAEQFVGIFQLVESAVTITEAAADIARILLADVGLPAEFQSAFPGAHEDLVRARVAPDSGLVGRTLAELDLDVELGVFLVALRRDSTWQFTPEGSDELRAGDVLIG